MGVINMAHGELLMVGAYATFRGEGVFCSHFPKGYPRPLRARRYRGLPRRRAGRHRHGAPGAAPPLRPPCWNSLLATWGLSLVLIQAARVLFGPQNLDSPTRRDVGRVELAGGVVLPYNRIVILGFAAFVLVLIWLMMQKTRLGMFVRAVTQNRPMAGCVGVPTARVDTLAFAIGSASRGWGGLALSQIAQRRPGDGYRLHRRRLHGGGARRRRPACRAGAGGARPGNRRQVPRGWAARSVAKILVLVFIIAFIQKRPQGIFALKGRFADS